MREFGEQHCWQKGKHQQRCEDVRTQEYGEMQYTGDQKQISITQYVVEFQAKYDFLYRDKISIF